MCNLPEGKVKLMVRLLEAINPANRTTSGLSASTSVSAGLTTSASAPAPASAPALASVPTLAPTSAPAPVSAPLLASAPTLAPTSAPAPVSAPVLASAPAPALVSAPALTAVSEISGSQLSPVPSTSKTSSDRHFLDVIKEEMTKQKRHSGLPLGKEEEDEDDDDNMTVIFDDSDKEEFSVLDRSFDSLVEEDIEPVRKDIWKKKVGSLKKKESEKQMAVSLRGWLKGKKGADSADTHPSVPEGLKSPPTMPLPSIGELMGEEKGKGKEMEDPYSPTDSPFSSFSQKDVTPSTSPETEENTGKKEKKRETRKREDTPAPGTTRKPKRLVYHPVPTAEDVGLFSSTDIMEPILPKVINDTLK